MTVINMVAIFLTGTGVLFFIAGTVGMLRFPDVYCRLHALTKADNTGLGFIVAGLALEETVIAGAVMLALGHDRIEDLRGLAVRAPLLVFTFALAGINLTGLPPSGGFVGKWLLLKAAMLSGQYVYVFVILAGGLLAACYIFRVLEVTLEKVPNETTPLAIPPRMQYAGLFIGFLAVALGLVASIPLKMLKGNTPFIGAMLMETVP